jgi:hypothetical protein
MEKQIKEDLKIIKFTPEPLFKSLAENEKEEFLSQCSTIFNNKVFKQVCDELGTQAILHCVQNSVDERDLAFNRGTVHGVSGLYQTMEGYNSQHQDIIKRKEEYDPNAII